LLVHKTTLAPVPLYPTQTPHAARTRTRAAEVGSQRLTAELRHGLTAHSKSEVRKGFNPRCTYYNALGRSIYV
jgi:hypothetical protein